MGVITSGMILIWSGAIVDIPPGFLLCDGTNGTPDLTDQFVIGAGDSFAPAATGGAATHFHDFTTDGHAHPIPAGPFLAGGADFDANTSIEQDTGETDTGSSYPPYYALAYIMKT